MRPAYNWRTRFSCPTHRNVERQSVSRNNGSVIRLLVFGCEVVYDVGPEGIQQQLFVFAIGDHIAVAQSFSQLDVASSGKVLPVLRGGDVQLIAKPQLARRGDDVGFERVREIQGDPAIPNQPVESRLSAHAEMLFDAHDIFNRQGSAPTLYQVFLDEAAQRIVWREEV